MEQIQVLDTATKEINETEAHSLLQTERSIENDASSDEEGKEIVNVFDEKLPDDYYDCCYIGCKNPFHGPCDICKEECGKVSEYCEVHYDHVIHTGKNKNTPLKINDARSAPEDMNNSSISDNKKKEDDVDDKNLIEEDEYKILYSLLVLAKIVSDSFFIYYIFYCFI